MPTIEFSQDFMATIPASVFGTDLLNNFQPFASHQIALFSRSNDNAVYPGCFLRIMQGSVPTDFTTLTTPISRQADRLINFTGNIWVISSGNPANIISTPVAAAASGIATWFLLQVHIPNNTTTLLHQAIGTVGGTGSGADLEISDTNIVSGQTYRINNLKLGFPSTYTY